MIERRNAPVLTDPEAVQALAGLLDAVVDVLADPCECDPTWTWPDRHARDCIWTTVRYHGRNGHYRRDPARVGTNVPVLGVVAERIAEPDA